MKPISEQEITDGELGYLMRWTYNKNKGNVEWDQIEYRNKTKVSLKSPILPGVKYTLYLVQAESRNCTWIRLDSNGLSI